MLKDKDTPFDCFSFDLLNLNCVYKEDGDITLDDSCKYIQDFVKKQFNRVINEDVAQIIGIIARDCAVEAYNNG